MNATHLTRNGLVAAALLLAATSSAFAAATPITWIGTSGSWSDVANWNPATVPDNTGLNFYEAIVTPAGAQIITFNGGTRDVDLLTVGSDDEILIAGGNRLQVNSSEGDGIVTNQGVIRIDSGGFNTYLQPRGGAPVQFQGGGEIIGDGLSCWFYEAAANSDLVNVDNTIRGAMNLGWNTTKIENGGTILADLSGVSLILDPDADGMVNTGTLAAENGGTLELRAATYTNTGGLIEGRAGGVVELNSSAIIQGGTLTTVGTGRVRSSGGTAQLHGVTNLGDLEIDNGARIQASGTLDNQGTITFLGTGANTYLQPRDSGLTLTGGGVVEMPNQSGLWIYDASTNASLTNVDNVIRGAGNIGWNTTTIVNQSDFIALYSEPMHIDPDAGGLTNTGRLLAESGGVMELAAGTYENSGGLIEARDASVVVLEGSSRIQNGLLGSVDTGVVRTESGTATVQNVSLYGDIDVVNGSRLHAEGTFHNTGVVRIDGTGANTYFQTTGGSEVQLTGGGTISLADTTGIWMYEALADSDLNNVDNTIEGAGNVGWNTTTIRNQGTIHANGNHVMDIDVDAGGFLNEGLLRVSGAGQLQLSPGPFTQAGQFQIDAGSVCVRETNPITQTAGTTTVDGTLALNSAAVQFVVNAGTLRGEGTCHPEVHNIGGRVEPGNPADETGTLQVLSDFRQEPGGTLAIQIGGYLPGESDVLQVADDVYLYGTVEVELVDGFVPIAGDQWVIVDGQSDITQAFVKQVVGVNLPVGIGAEVFVAGQDVYLRIITATDAPVVAVPQDLDQPLLVQPNPARGGRTQVAFQLHAGASRADLTIYDLTGRRVKTLASGEFGREPQFLTWDGRDAGGRQVAAGVYFARLTSANGVREVKRITVLR